MILFGHRVSGANLCEENGDVGDGSDDSEVIDVETTTLQSTAMWAMHVPAERFSSHHLLILHFEPVQLHRAANDNTAVSVQRMHDRSVCPTNFFGVYGQIPSAVK